MNRLLLLPLAALGLLSCTNRSPLDDAQLYPGRPAAVSPAVSGVRITFLGNTTLLISDGTTHLLVDGYFTRPGGPATLLAPIAPDDTVIERELDRAGITQLDALLVGHSHHDHALDTARVAQLRHARTMASSSYAHLHRGANNGSNAGLITVDDAQGGSHDFGAFTVTFLPAAHVGSHSFIQEAVEGSIEQDFAPPARYWRYKCGPVFAIHITHRQHGSLLVSTTAGAVPGEMRGKRADVAFLGVGLLEKEPAEKQELYWHETVIASGARTVVPVHWDNFGRKLEHGLRPMPRIMGHATAAIAVLQAKAREASPPRTVRAMDLHDTLLLRHGTLRW